MSKTVDIFVNVKGNATKALKSVQSQLGKTDKAVNKSAMAFKGLAVAAAGMAVMMKVNAWMKESIRLSKIQEDAERKLSASLGYTSKALLEYASALQKKTTYGDEETIASMALVANFVKEEEQIKRITKVSQDLATAKGMSLSQATDLVTKSVASSTNALSRYGITIEGTAGSVERIDSAVQALEKSFGGVAEAMAQTSSGQIKQMENEIGDLREEVGESLLPAMLSVKQTTVALYTYILDNQGAVNKAIGGITNVIQSTITVADYLFGGSNEDEAVAMSKRIEEQRAGVERYVAQLKKANAITTRPKGVSAYAYGGGTSEAEKQAKIAEATRALQQAKTKLRETEAEYNAIIAKRHELELKAQADEEARATAEATAIANAKALQELEEKRAKQRARAIEYQRKFKKLKEEEARWDTDWQEKLIANNAYLIELSAQQKIDAYDKEKAKRDENFATTIEMARATAQAMTSIFSAVNTRKQQEYDNDIARQKDDVKTSTMSAKQKAKAMEKIEKEASKRRLALRLSEWRQALVMSIVNTALGVTASSPNIPKMIAVGALGAIETGIIASNKPKMYNGGELNNMTGQQGDVIPFVGRKGERVVTPEEYRAMRGNTTNSVTIGAPQITIHGNADESAVNAIGEQLDNYARNIEEMFTSGAINPAIVNQALAV